VGIDDRQRRLGRNEALFREVNERIERVSQKLQVATESFKILCECGDTSCTDQLEVSLPEYERIRRDPTLFFVRPGHEQAEVDDAIEHTENYDVVRKKPGEAAEVARDLDPRAS
jgi:5-bromo-4-chloroindolyl phosphate hydrolysis protein